MGKNRGLDKARALAKRLGLTFHNWDLLVQALTHSSYRGVNPEAMDNQRLEFLGDAVLDLLVGEWLYHKCPNIPPKRLTDLRSALVDREQLARFARKLNLLTYMRFGRGALQKESNHERVLAEAFEALVAALYLDQGLDAVRTLLEPLVEEAFPAVLESVRNCKGKLQEWSQGQGLGIPEYDTEQIGGTPENPIFASRVYIQGKMYGEGRGRRKREAEQEAACEALRRLGLLE